MLGILHLCVDVRMSYPKAFSRVNCLYIRRSIYELQKDKKFGFRITEYRIIRMFVWQAGWQSAARDCYLVSS
jgi:hypothetical protein